MRPTQLKTLTLYIAEENQIYRMLFIDIFSSTSITNLVGISSELNPLLIKSTLSALQPSVLLLGTKSLDPRSVEQLLQIRSNFPHIGVVLLFSVYNAKSIKQLRKIAERHGGGLAVFLRHSLERAEQLYRIIISVSEGYVILDPSLTNLLLTEKQAPLISMGFTARELEIMSLIAEGYSNVAIAEALFIDTKTIRRHLNNMYSKLRADLMFNHQHPRVSLARLYLENTGNLTTCDAT